MKLIELLVQELPKRGGWPEGVAHIEMFMNGNIYFDGKIAPGTFKLPQCTDGWKSGMPPFYHNKVTREQYEAALAASQNVEWDGVGLPPVGCECEIKSTDDWIPVTILFNSDYYTIYKTFNGEEYGGEICALKFRPLRPESERKRDEAKHAIAELCRSSASNGHSADLIYDAIAAGKIPGVRIE